MRRPRAWTTLMWRLGFYLAVAAPSFLYAGVSKIFIATWFFVALMVEPVMWTCSIWELVAVWNWMHDVAKDDEPLLILHNPVLGLGAGQGAAQMAARAALQAGGGRPHPACPDHVFIFG